MKRFFIVAVISLISSFAFSQDKVNVEDVNKHLDEKATVCSKVFGIKFFDKSQMTLLNLGAAFPNSPLTVVILGKDLANFKVAPEKMYADKDICVTGTIKEFKGKTEIVVSDPSQIIIK